MTSGPRKTARKKGYLTPNEVAEMLMVSPVTVRLWAQKGQLKAEMTPGGHRRFLYRDVERFASAHDISLQHIDNEQLRILIVEDDEQLAKFLVELLTGVPEPVVVETANDGFDAGRKIEAFNPHVVLLDLMMPGIDGFEVCRILKESPATRAIRVIAMTGFYVQENVDRIIACGAEACLRKPIDTATLLAEIGLQEKLSKAKSK